jgi:4-hydroxy-2-oxoglutarate aldolase
LAVRVQVPLRVQESRLLPAFFVVAGSKLLIQEFMLFGGRTWQSQDDFNLLIPFHGKTNFHYLSDFKNHIMLKLNGIIPAVPTPFDPEGNLATDKLKENFNYWNRFDLRGYLMLGSNGEMVMLTHRERLEVLEAARNLIPGDKIMMAGTGCQSTRETIELTKKAARIGVDAALVLNPFYYKELMTRRILEVHYFSVADASPIPVLIYNMPFNTGIDLNPEIIISLSGHENIIGLKDSGGNTVNMGIIMDSAGNEFQILAGSADFLLPALSIGAAGGILALANIAPQLCIDLYRSFSSGEKERSRDLQSKIIKLNTAVTRHRGVPAMKEAMQFIGLYGGPPRKPLMPLSGEAREQLHGVLTGFYPQPGESKK